MSRKWDFGNKKAANNAIHCYSGMILTFILPNHYQANKSATDLLSPLKAYLNGHLHKVCLHQRLSVINQ